MFSSWGFEWLKTPASKQSGRWRENAIRKIQHQLFQQERPQAQWKKRLLSLTLCHGYKYDKFWQVTDLFVLLFFFFFSKQQPRHWLTLSQELQRHCQQVEINNLMITVTIKKKKRHIHHYAAHDCSDGTGAALTWERQQCQSSAVIRQRAKKEEKLWRITATPLPFSAASCSQRCFDIPQIILQCA